MKKLFFALVAVLFAACSTDLTEDVAVAAPDSIEVSFEEESRIQLSDDKTVWTKGDLLSVFYRSDANEQWKFQGNTGDRSGSIKRVMKPNATTKLSKIVAVYPYNENYYINPVSCNIEAMLPAEQTYLKDSYGLDGNILVSQSEFNQIALRNVCGWLKIQLKGDGQVIEKITLKGNNNEQVAGLIYIDSSDATATLATEYPADSDDGVGGTLILDDTILKEVTLNCGEGVTLGSTATAFYIALPPQTFEKGFNVEVYCKGYEPMNISTSNVINIERNHILPMSSVAFEAEERTIANNEIWYVASQNINNSNWTYDTFGANVVSNEWDSLSGEGIITFDSDVTTIGLRAFIGSYLTEITIPHSVTLIGDSAFSSSRLKKITIPKGVKKIGHMAFAYSLLENITFEANSELETIDTGAFNYCRHLTRITIPSSVQFIGDCVFGGCERLAEILSYGKKYVDNIGGLLCEHNTSPYKVLACPSGRAEDRLICGGLYTKLLWGAFSYGNIKYVDIWIQEIDQYNFIYDDVLEGVDLTRTTTIANDVLSYCSKLKELRLPIVSSIGSHSFSHNSSLETIKLESESLSELNTIANDNESLHSIYLASNITSISSCFNSCGSLSNVHCKAITPPVLTDSFDSVNTLTVYVPAESVHAYKSNNGWKKYTIVGYDFENGVVVPGQPNNEIWYTATTHISPNSSDVFGANIISNEWDAETGKGVLQFDGEVTMIGGYAFSGCSSLTSLAIPNSVTSIEYNAFNACSSLKSIILPDSLTRISNCAFDGCSSLECVTIPDAVTSIGGYAFSGCSSLTNLAIPNSVTSIEDGAFNACSSLKSIILPDSLTRISNCAFDGCSSLECVTIPDAVTSIGVYAFLNCSSLESVAIGSSVTSIGGSAFHGCSNLNSVYISDLSAWCKISFGYWTFSNPLSNGAKLYLNNIEVTELTIPSDITEIKDYTFEGCKSLTSLTIPDSLTSIGDNAFAGCTYLKEVYCKAMTPPSGYSSMFTSSADDLVIYVPRHYVEDYKAANGWGDYADRIEPYDFE